MFDVVYISYKEPDKEQRFSNLKKIIPFIKRIDNVQGIHNAHVKAA